MFFDCLSDEDHDEHDADKVIHGVEVAVVVRQMVEAESTQEVSDLKNIGGKGVRCRRRVCQDCPY